MPFDPLQPAQGSPLDSALMRAQLNGLYELIVPGPQGEPGPAFATIIVDAVITLPTGSAATVAATLVGNEVQLVIGLPMGLTGPQGIQGPPGEVTAAQLSTAIAGTSNNTNGVALLGLTVSDPPTQAEVQAVANKLDALILAQRR